MKKVILFFNGIKRAIKDSWFAILILLLTCCIGIFGVGFCYRTIMFYIRQPEQIVDFEGQQVILYFFDGDKISVNNSIDIKGYIGKSASTQFIYDNCTYDLALIAKDSYNEGKLNFKSEQPQIVANENIGVNVGDILNINNTPFEVVGITYRNSYTNINYFETIDGYASFYFENQLSRADIKILENAVGEKLNRDMNWQGKLTSQTYLFIVLCVIIIILISINVFRLFNLYQRKNNKRYEIYQMIGISKNRLYFIKFGESFLLLLLGLPIALMLDSFLLRPFTKLLGIVFMYDFFDILIISICILLPFALVIIGNLLYQAVISAKKRSS